MKWILVTGGAGFIGSNFVQYMLDHQTDLVRLVNLDLLTYAGNLENLKGVEGDPRYCFVKGDIRDKDLVEKLFAEHDFDTVVHFAAESGAVSHHQYRRDPDPAGCRHAPLEAFT